MKLIWISFFLVSISAFSFESLSEDRFYSSFPFEGIRSADNAFLDQDGPLIAIYNDTGVWETGYEHLKLFFKEYGYSYTSINARKIRQGYLHKSKPDILVMPGGASWKYLSSLGTKGGKIIKEFVANGGAYLGICAGAFYATSLREGGYATGPYGIGLLEGTAYDGTALETEPFKDGMLIFNMHIEDLAKELTMILLGGPSFLYSKEEQKKKNIRVVSSFPKIDHPAMILFEYDDGKVFISGPHLEVEEDLMNSSEYVDPETDWPLLNLMFESLVE